MREQRSVAIIFRNMLILGLIIIPSCSAPVNNVQKSSAQSAPNAVILDNSSLSDIANTLTKTGQQPPVCSTPNVPIPDMGTRSNTISVPDTGTLSDLDVTLNILHPYVGDLVITLNHIDDSGPVTLINRPGCGGANIDVTINDEGLNGDIVNQCEDAPAINGDRIGGNPAGPVLSIFDGNDYSGDWILTISDNSRGDEGTLVKWCLIPTIIQAPDTSTGTGTIEIIKHTIPHDAQVFTFTITDGLSPSTFDLDDDADGTVSNIQTYNHVKADTYTVSEAVVSGYSTSVSCVDPTGDTTTADSNAIIDLAADETVTCTFVNTQIANE